MLEKEMFSKILVNIFNHSCTHEYFLLADLLRPFHIDPQSCFGIQAFENTNHFDKKSMHLAIDSSVSQHSLNNMHLVFKTHMVNVFMMYPIPPIVIRGTVTFVSYQSGNHKKYVFGH